MRLDDKGGGTSDPSYASRCPAAQSFRKESTLRPQPVPNTVEAARRLHHCHRLIPVSAVHPLASQ
jgi:hypothetical protein